MAYVDNEPVAVAHSEAIIGGVPNTSITGADLGDPETVLAAHGVAGLLDFTAPIALLALTAMHFVPDEQDPSEILGRYRRSLAPESLLVMSHSSVDYPEHQDMVRAHRRVDDLLRQTPNPVYPRSRGEILDMVAAAGFAPNTDGLVDISRFARPPQAEPLGAYTLISVPLAPSP